MLVLLRFLAYPLLLAALWWLGHRVGQSGVPTNSAPDLAAAGQVVVWLVAYAGCALVLAVLAAWEVSSWLGSLSEQWILGGGGALRFDPRLKQAERLRLKREPLEAIRLLREVVTDHPRDWLTRLRIAELYQQDLNNPLAAVLEYEDLLRGRLPRAARPWVQLRYGDVLLHQGRLQDAITVFESIVQKHPRSGAAEKASRRLHAGEPPGEAAEPENRNPLAAEPS